MIERYVSREELKRLISALLVVATFLIICAFFAFLIVPGMRNANQRTEEAPINAPQGETGWLDPTDTPAEKGRILPPIDPVTVMKPHPDLLAQGKALYVQTCASCHGEAGKGDGPAAGSLNPKPRDLTQKEAWKNGPRMDGIYRTLEEGIKGSSMVAYAYLSKRDRMALVHQVQTLTAFDRGPEDPKALDLMAQQFASKGEVIPNRIPVSRAMTVLAQEATLPAPLAAHSPMLTLAVADPLRAAQTLSTLKGWKESEAVLAKALVAGVPANGFRPVIATFTPEQWKQLQQELSR